MALTSRNLVWDKPAGDPLAGVVQDVQSSIQPPDKMPEATLRTLAAQAPEDSTNEIQLLVPFVKPVFHPQPPDLSDSFLALKSNPEDLHQEALKYVSANIGKSSSLAETSSL